MFRSEVDDMRLASTTTASSVRAHRVSVAEELVGARCDYADAFEIEVPASDAWTAEQWARHVVEGAPPAVRRTIVFAHRFVLGLRLAPASSPDHVLGWDIEENRPGVLRLAAASPFMRAEIVARRLERSRIRLTTLGHYTRPVPGRLIWVAVGPVHRRFAPYLLEHGVRSRAAH
jgi:hypothetical protein